jgi:hypothetical protein
MSAEAYANRGDYYVHIKGLHNTVSVKFKAIIANFKDSLVTNYNSEEVYGRIDPIMTFQGTTRKLSMTLEIPAYSAGEAQQNFQSLSQLMASQYPGYDTAGSATSISTAPLHKIKFANWVTAGGAQGSVNEAGLVVALEGVSFSPNLDAGVITNGPKILPKQFDLELQMTVLHTDQIGWNPDGWMGNRRYPYTEIAEDISLNNPEDGELNMTLPVDVSDDTVSTIDPVTGVGTGTFYENVNQALQDILLGGNQMRFGPGMSYEDPDNL